MLIRELFQFIFVDRSSEYGEILPIESLETSRRSKPKRISKKNQEKPIKRKQEEPKNRFNVGDTVIINTNRLLGIVLISSFLAIITFAIIGKTDQLPSVVSYAFSSTLGYFGGIIVNYMDKVTEKK